jgi:hypothetical protein
LRAESCVHDLVGEVSKASFAGLDNGWAQYAGLSSHEMRTWVACVECGNGPSADIIR